MTDMCTPGYGDYDLQMLLPKYVHVAPVDGLGLYSRTSYDIS